MILLGYFISRQWKHTESDFIQATKIDGINVDIVEFVYVAVGLDGEVVSRAIELEMNDE